MCPNCVDEIAGLKGIIARQDRELASLRKQVNIEQQTIDDDAVSGLTLKFIGPRSDGSSKLVIIGDLPFGNREFIFEPAGSHGGSGTFVGDMCDSRKPDSEVT